MLPTFCLSGILFALLTGAQGAKQPHILFILADDYGWNDVGNGTSFSLTTFFYCFNENFLNINWLQCIKYTSEVAHAKICINPLIQATMGPRSKHLILMLSPLKE